MEIMSEQETNSEIQFTQEQLDQLAQFVAGKMFQSISFNYVLNMIENQCVAQGKARIAEAPPEQLQQIYSDYQTFQLEQQLGAGQGAQAQVDPTISVEDLDTSTVVSDVSN